MTGETILWHGQPNYSRWYIVPVLYVAAFFSWIYLDPSRFNSTLTSAENLHGGVFITGLLTLFWLRMVFKYGGVHYYVTNRRIVRKQDLPILRTVKETLWKKLQQSSQSATWAWVSCFHVIKGVSPRFRQS